MKKSPKKVAPPLLFYVVFFTTPVRFLFGFEFFLTEVHPC